MIGFLKNWSDAHSKKIREKCFRCDARFSSFNKEKQKQAKISTPFLNFCFDASMTRLHNCRHFEATRALYPCMARSLALIVWPFARFDLIYRTQVRTQGTAGSELQLHNQRS